MVSLAATYESQDSSTEIENIQQAFTADQYKQLEELTQHWKPGQYERGITLTDEFN